ncbi:lytic transglycosylase domain-containing protein [Sporosarcina thermotolerans]|uniref:Lytic transglycosylase domain-containing protein n=1 Tax=Sporosarcina thermotolerans TaxID=633404 RepID=A0AAW9A7Q9_9BACL|nr:lytic transglycosylase domain-containing protein [Sporosarcina thermotolerans]MDW0117020.1 lytic transglycosylase domain-containing protein [Sporosarcina thermotolerans]
MDARTVRTLMDIQAMQTLGSVQSFSSVQETTSTLFSDMMTIALDDINNKSFNPNSVMNQSFGMLDGLRSMESLLYKGSSNVYLPKGLEFVLQKNDFSSTDDSSGNTNFSGFIKRAAETYGLPVNLITSVIKQESDFNNTAVSGAGAMGLMQLMPGTAKFLGVQDSFDPEQNIMGGAKYLRQMLDQFGNIELALAAYNAGPGNVKKYDGIPPFKETQNYVSKVLNYYKT